MRNSIYLETFLQTLRNSVRSISDQSQKQREIMSSILTHSLMQRESRWYIIQEQLQILALTFHSNYSTDSANMQHEQQINKNVPVLQILSAN